MLARILRGCQRVLSTCKSCNKKWMETDVSLKSLGHDDVVPHPELQDDLNRDRPYFYNKMTSNEADIKFSKLCDASIKKLKSLQLEYDMLLSEDNPNVPKNVTSLQWLQVMELGSTEGKRKNLYHYFMNAELRRAGRKNKNVSVPEIDNNGFNCIHVWLRKSSMNTYHYYGNLAYAMLFEPTVIIDFEQANQTSYEGIASLYNQYKIAYGANRTSKLPFDLHVCNASRFNKLVRHIKWHDYRWDSMVNVHQESYVDIFPLNKLVYLTADSPNILIDTNPDDIYIVGAVFDKNHEVPWSYSKALSEGIRTARLPIKQYASWISSSENILLDQTFKIMLDYKISKDWNIAFRNLPVRKQFLAMQKTNPSASEKQNRFRAFYKSEANSVNSTSNSLRHQTRNREIVFKKI